MAFASMTKEEIRARLLGGLSPPNTPAPPCDQRAPGHHCSKIEKLQLRYVGCTAAKEQQPGCPNNSHNGIKKESTESARRQGFHAFHAGTTWVFSLACTIAGDGDFNLRENQSLWEKEKIIEQGLQTSKRAKGSISPARILFTFADPVIHHHNHQ